MGSTSVSLRSGNYNWETTIGRLKLGDYNWGITIGRRRLPLGAYNWDSGSLLWELGVYSGNLLWESGSLGLPILDLRGLAYNIYLLAVGGSDVSDSRTLLLHRLIHGYFTAVSRIFHG